MHYANNSFQPHPSWEQIEHFVHCFYTFYNHYQVCYTLRSILQKNTKIGVVTIFWDMCHLNNYVVKPLSGFSVQLRSAKQHQNQYYPPSPPTSSKNHPCLKWELLLVDTF